MNKDGGWAFPNSHRICPSDGMTLRQYYAGLAMQGMLNNKKRNITYDRQHIPVHAFLIADAMIEEGERDEQTD